MEKKSNGADSTTSKLVFLLGLIVVLLHLCPTTLSQSEDMASENEGQQQAEPVTYIVHCHMEDESEDDYPVENRHDYYHSLLAPTREESSKVMKHAYNNVIKGFAAKLTADQAKALEKREGFVSARPERMLSLHTTYSASFLGLHENAGVLKDSNFGKGVIIGVLDTGIRPDHPSFSGDGMPPPPAKWRGRCDFTGEAICNNKLLGAKNFFDDKSKKLPPIDYEGHGTHTASVAAGAMVKNAGEFDNAEGTAIGMAPLAHLAIYKVCNLTECPESAILAAIDAAIDDGVDIISMSLGEASVPFFENLMAVGAMAATQNGILVSTSAGNEGPRYGSIANEAPWLLTVGASTTDRTIKATVRLGNGVEYDGQSLFQPRDFELDYVPLAYAGHLENKSSVFCATGSLINFSETLKGKVVLCERGGNISRMDKGIEVKNAGGIAMVLVNQKEDGYSTSADPHVLPASHLSYDAGLKIKDYINSSTSPNATIIFKGTVIGDELAPAVASFSARGPNIQSPGILKPDIVGPGVSILAAWPFSVDRDAKEKANFNMLSGTSMSCPHLSGIAALLKSSHPDWSPAAIKSSMMTTADTMNLGGKLIVDETLEPANLFAIGAGHVNPTKANDPGLLYDIQMDDYTAYLCGMGYSNTEVSMLIQRRIKCFEVKGITESQLNYPSFSVVIGNISQYLTRTLTNVGLANETYKVELNLPSTVGIVVNPTTLTFTELNQKLSYSVEFTPKMNEDKGNATYAQGFLQWVSEKHTVRSPISVKLS